MKKGKVISIIAARMGSQRFPGKVLKEPISSKSLLELMIERVQRAKKVDLIVVATTTKKRDDPIVNLCNRLNISVFRGNENDVLKRYFDTAVKYNADTVVRLTGDCPLIDPSIIDRVIKEYLDGDFDYVTNVLGRSFPRGMDVEVFSKKTLVKLNLMGKEPIYREHVTYYIHENRGEFKTKNITANKMEARPDLRLTVDTELDFLVIKNIFENLYPNDCQLNLNDVINYLNKHPEIASINKEIEQKSLR